MQILVYCRALLTIALAYVAVASAGCSKACTADYEPTVAANGLTYMNTCVASCQGATVLTSSSAQRAAGRPVTAADMGAHAAEGFHFVDFGRVRRFQPTLRGSSATVSAPSLKGLPLDRVVLYDVARGAIYASTAAAEVPAYPAAAISTAAVVGQPDEQLHKPQAPAAAADGEPSAPQSPEGPSQALNPAAAVQQESAKAQVPAPAIVTRKLRFVQPTDERRAVSTAPATLPLAAVGQLLSYGQKWHCSASLIGERTLLTAAHCVYDRTTGAFAHGLYFVPGRFLDTSGSIRAPYGAFDISEVFVSSQYVAGEPQDIWGADLAIVRLNKNVQLGKVVGYLGISVPAVGSSSSSSGTADPAAKAIKATAAGPVVRDIAEPVAAAVAAAAEHAGGRKTRLGRQQQQQPSAAASTTQAAAAAWRGELATAGYPKDRPEGSLVRTQCQAEQLLSNAAFDTIKLTGCSTQLGQSGSPIMNSASQVRGTVSFEIAGEDGYNGAAAITHFSYNTLIREYVV